ncbi:hypothetical protein ACQPZA_33530 [Pseudonocardia xinjiangensis]|uniref:hypothetical protein n=1 Tax=Pseudonocardia xinjiangensis TaxID=75289 RepID=UPI003D8DB014
MLKKVGIMAAAATAGMLALSPLAFAHDYDRGHDRDRDDRGSQSTLFAFEDDSVERNQVNLCSFDQDSTVTPGLVGAILPLISQDQNGNCVNLGDGAEAEDDDDAAPTPAPVPPAAVAP